MDRRQFTPTRHLKQTGVLSTSSQSYLKHTPLQQSSTGNTGTRLSQISMLKDYEALKIQVRQLESQNRNLHSEIDRLRQEKSINENKYIQKMNFQEETLSQFQKQKNYQLELLQLKHDQDSNRIRRECENQVEDLTREIKNRDYQVREKAEQVDYLQLKNGELNKELNSLQKELIRSRDQNSQINELLTKEQFANKKLQMLADQLQRHKDEMEGQIHVLLDIEAEKSKTINYLETQLRNSQNNEKSLNDKLVLLTQNFTALQDHIAVMKEKLISSDTQNRTLQEDLHHVQIILREKQNALNEHDNIEAALRKSLDETQMRQRRREKQVNELIDENQRLYKELNFSKHRLHDICVAYGIDA